MQRPAGDRAADSSLTEMHNPGVLPLSYHWSYNLKGDPKRLGFVLARYQFAARMACRDGSVLELGCSEGIGAPILARQAHSYLGVDIDAPAIEYARLNWADARLRFLDEDFMGKDYGRFDTIVSMDVVEHIYPEFADHYWQTVRRNLSETGVALIGTPNLSAAPYASEASMRGHVNLYDARRLLAAMQRICHHSFLFGINDEVVHTGYYPMCHFLVVMGCKPRLEMLP